MPHGSIHLCISGCGRRGGSENGRRNELRASMGVEIDFELTFWLVLLFVYYSDAFTLSGNDTEGAFPVILGHEGELGPLEGKEGGSNARAD